MAHFVLTGYTVPTSQSPLLQGEALPFKPSAPKLKVGQTLLSQKKTSDSLSNLFPHPKLTYPLILKGHESSSNHQFSRDMLVLRGAHAGLISNMYTTF